MAAVAAGAVIAGAGLVASSVGSALGMSKAAKQFRAQKKAVRLEGAARLRDLYKQEQAVIGQQRALYASANVGAGVGSAALAQEETRSEYARQQGLTALLTRQRERGAQAQLDAGRTSLAAGFASDLSQMAQLAYTFNAGRTMGGGRPPPTINPTVTVGG